jgi:hypothetical protein
MEKINDFESVITALKNYQVVEIGNPVKTNFSLRNNKIFVKTNNAHYSITLEEFEALFKNSIFYYFEQTQSSEIETSKDDEYYAWKHK